MQSAKGGGAIPQQYTGKAQRFSPCVALSPCVARKGGKILGKNHQSLKRQSLKRQNLKRKNQNSLKSKFPKVKSPPQKKMKRFKETLQDVVMVLVVVISVKVLKL